MKNLIGLITLFSITVGDTYAQNTRDRNSDTVFFNFIEFDLHVGYPDNNSRKNNFEEVNIFNDIESERQREEKERLRMIEKYIDSMKVVMFTKIMELTESEAAVFWPEYKNYQGKLKKILIKRKEANDKMCNIFRKYKIREYQSFVDIEVKSHKEEALVIEQYAEKFKEILGNKFYLLYRAEHIFNRWFFNTII
ncbi:MAG: hypothetical protein LBE04_01470 [Prevotellaceae bacterium]|jgi:hypothetical protein|nr:hypothetical protein [Prevotellaceae bacterium]